MISSRCSVGKSSRKVALAGIVGTADDVAGSKAVFSKGANACCVGKIIRC